MSSARPDPHPGAAGPVARLATGLATQLATELRRAVEDLSGQARAAGPALRSGSAWAWGLVALWTVGIVGDALTTVLMMRTGRFEEANVAAAALMGSVGTDTWVVLSSVVCVAIASLSLARPSTTYAWTAAAVATVVCLGKVWTTVSNALLWWSAS